MAVTSNIANSRAKYSELNEDARESLGAKGMDEIYKKVAKKEEKRKQEPQNNAIVKVPFFVQSAQPGLQVSIQPKEPGFNGQGVN